MKAAGSSKVFLFSIQTALGHIREHSTFHAHRCKKLKPQNIPSYFKYTNENPPKLEVFSLLPEDPGAQLAPYAMCSPASRILFIKAKQTSRGQEYMNLCRHGLEHRLR
jgi:hypothetical protein